MRARIRSLKETWKKKAYGGGYTDKFETNVFVIEECISSVYTRESKSEEHV